MSKISAAKALEPVMAPIESLRAAGFRTSLFQGVAYAVDPRTNYGYLFQMQAVRTAVGEIEDIRIHRFHLAPTLGAMIYLDTMTILGAGHIQNAHVRISAAGNPHLWMGFERYDKSNVKVGNDLYRARYTPGAVVNRIAVPRVYTGTGNVSAVGCPDWTVVLRRAGGEYDTFEWHRELGLLSGETQRAAKKGTRPKPHFTVHVPKKTEDDDYQSALAVGKWNSKSGRRIFRITGADVCKVTDSLSDNDMLDFTDQARAALNPGTDNVEPEGAFWMDNKLYVSVQTGSIAERRVAYFPLEL